MEEQAPSTTRSELPRYMRSFLQVKTPVSVTLAQKKIPLKQVVSIGVGTILHFDKSCDGLLELEVNGLRIGAGEAVKVGDKFGLRVAALMQPGERFSAARPE